MERDREDDVVVFEWLSAVGLCRSRKVDGEVTLSYDSLECVTVDEGWLRCAGTTVRRGRRVRDFANVAPARELPSRRRSAKGEGFSRRMGEISMTVELWPVEG